MIHPRRENAGISATGPGRELSLLLPPITLRGALCPTVDPELFFPEKGIPGSDAKKVCRACDVRVACLEYALEVEGGSRGHGIYGGMSPGERLKLARSRQNGTAA